MDIGIGGTVGIINITVVNGANVINPVVAGVVGTNSVVDDVVIRRTPAAMTEVLGDAVEIMIHIIVRSLSLLHAVMS